MPNEWLMIAGMTLVTILPRYGVLALLGRVEMPRPLFQALRFVPVAVLSAIIVPDIALVNGVLDLSPQNSFLIAGLVAGAVAWWRKNLLLTIVVGMGTLWLWRALILGG
ncbi:MAG: AzlD domain-containing protein [Anaerolineae bacterium]|nr:AzlD domain-containing protein [Anaerolineae bacterium]